MNDVLLATVSSISPAALPLVVVVVAFGYLYFLYRKIQLERGDQKKVRDNDSAELHEKCMKNSWEIHRLKEECSHRDVLLDDLRQQVNELNVNLALVAQKIDTLVEAIKELRR